MSAKAWFSPTDDTIFSEMYCPKCADPLKEQRGLFVCERGQMELSESMTERLYSGFVSKTEEPEEFRFNNAGHHFGGQWFCAGCGVLMNEEKPGAVRCPRCRRNIGKYLHQLIELHPHAGR
jgi:rubrerythrin